MLKPSDAQRSALLCLDQLLHNIGLPAEGSVAAEGERALGEQPTSSEIADLAQRFGVSMRVRRMEIKRLARRRPKYPLLLRLENGNTVICYGPRDGGGGPFQIYDPLSADIRRLDVEPEALAKVWHGETLQVRAWRLPQGQREFGLGWFFAHLTADPASLTAIVAAAFFMNLFALAIPFYMMIVLDKVVGTQGVATLNTLTMGVVGILVFEMVFSLIRGAIHANAAHEVDVRIGDRVLAHILQLPLRYFHTTEHGLISRAVLQVSRIREFLTGRLLTTGIDLLFVVIFLVVLHYISPTLFLLVMGFGLAVTLVALFSFWLLRGDARRFNKADTRREGVLVESVAGMETVKTLALEPVIRGKWGSINGLTSKYKYALIRSSTLARILTEIAEKGMSIAIVWLGAHEVITGALSVGGFVAANMVARRVVAPISQMSHLIREFYEIRFSANLIGQLLGQETEQTEGGSGKLRKELQGRITLQEVAFSYDPARGPTLKGIDLEIPPGSLVGVVGKSGSGKSTLTRLILGLYPPGSGKVFIDGVSISEIDHRALRAQVGTVIQESRLFKGTIRENIGIGGPPDDIERVLRAGALSGADEFIRNLPHGYDTPLEEGGVNLSGGQRQLIALARALYRAPRILILDEATSSLDAEKESSFQRNLRRMAQGRTTLIISHRLSLLANTDLNIVLDRGEIIAQGSHRELLEGCELYRTLWREQGGEARRLS